MTKSVTPSWHALAMQGPWNVELLLFQKKLLTSKIS